MSVTTRPNLPTTPAAMIEAQLPLPAAAMESTPLAPVAPASAVPAAVVTPASAEAKVNLPDPKVEVTVPVALTEAQVSAKTLREELLAHIYLWYGKRPVLTSNWREPTEDERNERIAALMQERSIKPTNFIAIGQLAAEVASQIDATRPNDDIAAQARRDRDYAIACLDAVLSLKDAVKAMGGLQSTTRKLTAPASGNDATGTRLEKAIARNKKLIDWAHEKGLGDCVLVDRTKGGYKGEYHAIIPLEDGTFERCDYDEDTGAIKRLGIIVKTPKWFEMTGVDGKPVSENMYRFYTVRMHTPSLFLKLAWLNGDDKGKYSSKGNFQTLLASLA